MQFSYFLKFATHFIYTLHEKRQYVMRSYSRWSSFRNVNCWVKPTYSSLPFVAAI